MEIKALRNKLPFGAQKEIAEAAKVSISTVILY